MLESRGRAVARRSFAWMVGIGLVSSCRFDYEVLTQSEGGTEGPVGGSFGGGAGAPGAGGSSPGSLGGSGGTTSGGFGGMGGAAVPACDDGEENGTESDRDCGGQCPPCEPGRSCEGPDDCESLICDGGVCTTPSCIDGVQNQEEEGLDCGGPHCPCCNPGVFEAPEKLSGFTLTGGLYGPSLSSDLSTLYFAAFETDEDIFVATRPDRGTVFSAATALSVNSASLDGTPSESADGLGLYFYSERTDTLGGRDLMVATRSSLTEEFAAPAFLVSANSAEVDQSPTLSSDELRLIFASLRPDGAGASDLWFAERASRDDLFGAPVNLTELNTAYTESGPSIARDELTLFFISNRPDSLGHDIWMATRTDRSGPFDAPTWVMQLSSAAEELDTALSADGRELFFSSNVDGEHELWRALRQCP